MLKEFWEPSVGTENNAWICHECLPISSFLLMLTAVTVSVSKDFRAVNYTIATFTPLCLEQLLLHSEWWLMQLTSVEAVAEWLFLLWLFLGVALPWDLSMTQWSQGQRTIWLKIFAPFKNHLSPLVLLCAPRINHACLHFLLRKFL